jgi:diguanylate cyclase (GGDEF)-like protein/PAS domain S-box-containing protein
MATTEPTPRQPPAGFYPALSSLIESAGTYVFTKDPSGRYTYANNQIEQLFGAELARIIGAKDADFYQANLAQSMRTNDLKVLESEETFAGLESGVVLSTGQFITFRTVKAPLYDLQNRVIGLCGIATDVSENVDLKTVISKKEQEFRILAQSTLGMAWSALPDGTGVYFSEAWLDYSGLTAQDCYGHRWDRFVHEDDAQSAQDQWNKALKNRSDYAIELRLRKHDGSYGWWLVRAVPAFGLDGAIRKWFGTCTDIHNFKIIEQNLIGDRAILQSVIDSVPAQIFAFDLKQKVLFANDAMAAFYGHETQDILGKDASAFLSPEELEKTAREAADIVKTGRASTRERLVHSRSHREPRILLSTNFPLHDLAGKIIGIGGVATDVAAARLAENELAIAATVFESALGVLAVNADFKILKSNSEFSLITGYSAREVIGKTPEMLVPTVLGRSIYLGMLDFLKSEDHWEGELKGQRKNKEIFPLHMSATAVKDSRGRTTNYVLRIADMTAKKAAAKEMQTLAFNDHLTGLPNRRHLARYLKRGFAASHRSKDMGALLFIDLDNFKLINDSLGHSVGDLLLKQVAMRLKTCVRQGDLVARLGGDEFLIILTRLGREPIEAAVRAEAVGEKILFELNESFYFGSHSHHCGASIGVTIFRESEAELEELLKQADIAMYESKHEGRNRLMFFNPSMEAVIQQRAKIESELRDAIKSDRFEIYYQRQVNRDLKVLGAEALLRWNHPTQGILSPKHFIEIAEDTSLIVPIGQNVLRQVCSQLKAWEKIPETRDLCVAINVSAPRFRGAGFVDEVLGTVQNYGVDPKLIKFELTEGVLLENKDEASERMQLLRKEGFEFALDDFGTGYSSLQYLQKLPIGQLKIDQSFIRDIALDAQDRAIVRTIISMASTLGLECIAEGVETDEQLRLLIEDGCEQFQGYLFDKPQPVEQFEAMLRATAKRGSRAIASAP